MDFKLEEYILPDRPYIICYMMQSLDGSSYGDWSQQTIETFKQVQIQEPNFKAKGIINGSSTMEKLYLPREEKAHLINIIVLVIYILWILQILKN